MTRQTARLMRQHGINQELVVTINRDIRADSLGYLANRANLANQPINAIPRRRASVAGGSLFSINNNVREAGFDFFQKIPRSNQVKVGANASSCNNDSAGPSRISIDDETFTEMVVN